MADYSTIDISQLDIEKPFYRGSVQNLYNIGNKKKLIISETTSGGSVFDVGTIFTIPGSDTARAGFRHLIYTKLANPESWQEISPIILRDTPHINDDFKLLLSELCENGANTHHLGMIEKETGLVFQKKFPTHLSNLTLIRKFNIQKPNFVKSMNTSFYDYSSYNKANNFVIPLEYIIRFGVTSGSSILRKFKSLQGSSKQDYLIELGVNNDLNSWDIFKQPIFDFTTKYEPDDRNISRQEAALISSLDGKNFSKSIMLSYFASYLVRHTFNQMGLFLWDLKWEIAKENNDLVFVDTIDTDSVRATLKIQKNGGDFFVHFNKQAMRDYYKIMHSNWYDAILESKKIASIEGKAFTDILKEGQQNGVYPLTPEVSPLFLNIQERKFDFITRFILESSNSNDYKEEAIEIANEEISFYLNSNYSESYKSLNFIM